MMGCYKPPKFEKDMNTHTSLVLMGGVTKPSRWEKDMNTPQTSFVKREKIFGKRTDD